MTSVARTAGCDSWFEQGEEYRQTLEAFKLSLFPSLSPVIEICVSLQEASEPFQEREEVFPVQCWKAVKVLTLLNMQLETCISLLKDTASLPLVFLALRYRLLEELYYTREQAHKLIDFLNTYSEVCMISSQSSSQREKSINRLFSVVLRSIDAIPQQTYFLIDEAKFQEQNLKSVHSQNL